MKIFNVTAACMLAVLTTLLSCDKFLSEKSDSSLVVPNTLTDLQALLDNSSARSSGYSSMSETFSDDYYLPEATYAGLAEHLQRQYTWQPDFIIQRSGQNDWLNVYQAVYFHSYVLQSIQDIPRTSVNHQQWDDIYGQALSLRALRYLDALQVWALAYDGATAQQDLGIPLRKEADFNAPSVRASVAQSYTEVISAFKQSVALLPEKAINASRPSKAMAYAGLARTYLFMRDYQQAGLYADSCLALQSDLLDYNTLDPRANQPFPSFFNQEVIFFAQMGAGNNITSNHARIPGSIINSYDPDDLRKTIFFRTDNAGLWQFKGQYTGTTVMSSSLTTAEMFLIRAESLIRLGDISAGLEALDILRINRYKRGTFTFSRAPDDQKALDLVLQERRMELIRRGLRWADIKRLNKEGREIILQRVIAGQIYTLPANDLRYAAALPEEVIELSDMPQNPR